MIKINKRQLVYLIGIGAFIISTLNVLTYLIKMGVRDFQILIGIEPSLNFWITELSVLLIFIIAEIVILKWFIKNDNYSKENIKKIFVFWIISFLGIEILQFIYPIVATPFILKNYEDVYFSYFNRLNSNRLITIMGSVFAILRYFIFGLILYIGQKLFIKNRYELSEIGKKE
ncbi:hypothetical protein GTQ40_01125 [Flavobacteriaceae bacterium R38]|nr:hypothetical protein [Flavobacteriaceae bacterium R38]